MSITLNENMSKKVSKQEKGASVSSFGFLNTNFRHHLRQGVTKGLIKKSLRANENVHFQYSVANLGVGYRKAAALPSISCAFLRQPNLFKI